MPNASTQAANEIAKSTGVETAAVEKVLGALGLDAVLAETTKLTAGAAPLRLQDLRISVRIAGLNVAL